MCVFTPFGIDDRLKQLDDEPEQQFEEDRFNQLRKNPSMKGKISKPALNQRI